MPRHQIANITPEQIRVLREGEDRNWHRRTWAEVAAETGYSASYLSKHFRGWTPPVQRPLVIDPREYEPALKDLTDEEVRAWQENPTCLCGCGEATQIESGADCRVPRGAPRLFRRNHFRKLDFYKEHWRAANRTPERIATIRATHAAHMEVAAEVRETIYVWVHAEPARTIAELAELTGLTQNRLHGIGQRKFVKRLTAARIYAAIGEPMTADMAREYTAWLKRERRIGPWPILQARRESTEQ